MASEPTPQNYDLVLGRQLPPPTSGAVLGGIAGLSHRFEQGDMSQKLAMLVQAAQHKDGLDLLYRALEHENLLVRAEAYTQLKAIASASFVPASFVSSPILNRGIPLKVGDRIYAVYRSSVAYGDDWYYIDADISEWYHDSYPFYKEDVSGEPFSYISDLPKDNQMHPSDAYEMPNLIAYYIDRESAAAKAKTVYEEKFGKLDCEVYEVDRYIESEADSAAATIDLKAWVEAHQIVVDAKLPEGWEDDYETQVLMSLQSQKQFSLLRELWQQNGYRPLAFAYEYVIDRPCYLRLTALEA